MKENTLKKTLQPVFIILDFFLTPANQLIKTRSLQLMLCLSFGLLSFNIGKAQTTSRTFINEGTELIKLYVAGKEVASIDFGRSQRVDGLKLHDEIEVKVPGNPEKIWYPIYINDLKDPGLITITAQIPWGDPGNDIRSRYERPIDFGNNLDGILISDFDPFCVVNSFKARIFKGIENNSVDYNLESNHILPLGFTYNGSIGNGGGESESSLVVGANSFKKQLNVGFGGSFPLEQTGKVKGELDFSYNQTNSTRLGQSDYFFYAKQKHNKYSVSLDLNKLHEVRLDPYFIADVEKISSLEMARKFIQTYGTNYPTTVVYGGAYTSYIAISESDFMNAESKGFNLAAGVSLSKPGEKTINPNDKGGKTITGSSGSSEVASGKLQAGLQVDREVRDIINNSNSQFTYCGGSGDFFGYGVDFDDATSIGVETGVIYELIRPEIMKTKSTEATLSKIRTWVKQAVDEVVQNINTYDPTKIVTRVFSVKLNSFHMSDHSDDANRKVKGSFSVRSSSGNSYTLWSQGQFKEIFTNELFNNPNKNWVTFIQKSDQNGVFAPVSLSFSGSITEEDDVVGSGDDDILQIIEGQTIDVSNMGPQKPHKVIFEHNILSGTQRMTIEADLIIRPAFGFAHLFPSSGTFSASRSGTTDSSPLLQLPTRNATTGGPAPSTMTKEEFDALSKGRPVAVKDNLAVKDDFIDLNATYYITDAKHNKSLVTGMVYGGGVYHQTPRNSPVDASWYFLPTGDGYYYIYDLRYNKALAGPDYYNHLGGGTHFVYHQDPNGRTNAQWKITPSGMPGKYIITDRKHGKSLVAGDVADNNIYLQSPNNRLNAYWTFTATKDKAPAVKPDPNPTPTPTASTTPVTTKPATNTLAPASAGLVRIMSIMGFNNYLHHQNNKPENGQIQADWSSSQWRLVPVEGGLVRIQSSVHPDKYLHIQNGPLELGTIDLNWASALWKLVPAQAGVIRIQSSLHPDKYFYPLGNDVVVDVVDFNSYSGPVVSSMWKIEGEIPTTASNTPTETVPATTAAAANTMTPASPGYVRIQNYWKKTHYVHNENGALEDGLIQPNWWSSQWKIVPVHSGWVRIQNKWKPDQYLHNQNGKLEVGTIEPNWASAMWKLVPASQDGWVRIQNSWYQNRYIHNQNGKIEVGEIDTNWGSALWKVE